MHADWASITTELDTQGGALLPRLVTDAAAAQLRARYDDDHRFRSTIDMARYRFGAGQYRYFQPPYPQPIVQLKQALYPRLLPIARDWYAKLGREAPWPDTLDEWLDRCHRAGQTRSTAIPLRYRQDDWNALHRDLPRHRLHRRRVPLGRATTAGTVPRNLFPDTERPRVRIHHP
jgi:hypothetical protein